MRWSKTLIPTVKEFPADAEVVSHKLMVRAGMIRKLASGAYTYLPLGFRSLRKAIQIVRREMDRAGALEVVLPIIQPVELWQKTGRDEVFKDILFTSIDHHGRGNVLSPTAEEAVTSLIANELSSYRQLPVNLYQIHEKFRDEFRPQYGVIRSREFLMKDAYSFDADAAGLDASYQKMYDAYCRIFSAAGLKYVIVQADSGGMGGTDTEEFMAPAEIGDTLVSTADGKYWANIERAEVDPLPLTDEAKAARAAVPPVEEVHTPNVGTIDAVCAFLKTQPAEMIKTIIYSARHAESQRRSAVAVLVRGDHEINDSKLAGLVGTSMTVELADADVVRSITDAAVGFAGPVGLTGKVGEFIVDHAVAAMAAGVSGANKTDYHVRNVVPGRDFPLDGPNVVVADVRSATESDTRAGQPLRFSRGIEIGHVFKLGTKYSEKLGAVYLDDKGISHPMVMGCYGVGVNRILAAAIESFHDDKGIIWPISIAPYEVLIVPVGADRSQAVRDASEKIYAELLAGGVDVLIDDRDARPGVKFNDADLIGIPVRVTVGDKALKDGNVELKLRREANVQLIPAADAAARIRQVVAALYAELA